MEKCAQKRLKNCLDFDAGISYTGPQSYTKEGRKMNLRTNLYVYLAIVAIVLGMVCTPVIGRTIYVDANTPDNNDGSSWSVAYKYLQNALADANSSGDVNEIWVAQGIYKPDQNSADPNGSGDRMATFELIDGVSMYGGFPTGGGMWDDRDPNIYETILSGDLNDNDEPNFVNYSDNSYHVIMGSGIGGTTILDGLIVTAGNATGAGANEGAGIYLDQGSPKIIDCTFIHNDGDLAGGGISIYPNGGSPVIEKCKFEQNRADYGGGFSHIRPVYDSSKPVFKNCSFIQNVSTEEGGGLWVHECIMSQCAFINNDSKKGGAIYFAGQWDGPSITIETYPTVINCEFAGNTAGSNGGGAIHSYSATIPSFINCMFTGNYTEGDVGAVIVACFNPRRTNIYLSITNCSFAGNEAAGVGGGCYIYTDDIAETTIKNTILWANVDSIGSGESSQVTGGTLFVSSSCIQDDDPNDANIPFGGAANNNIDDNPNFVRDPNDGGDGWGVGDNDDFGNLRLSPGSPCIDDANNAAVPPDSNDIDNDGNTTEPIPWDLDERPRFADGDCNSTDIVDMGAYEFTYAYFGDFDSQCDVDFVDFVDFSILASQWLEPPGSPSADIAPEDLDGIVDNQDLAVLVEHWLETFP